MNGQSFLKKTFSFPASAGTPAECERVGHTEPDRRGRCLRCSAKVRYALTDAGRDATEGTE